MFARLTNALYNAVDALAPPLPLQEDFIWHWKGVTRFFTGRNASSTVPVESTTIPGHLSEMLSILQQEEDEVETGSIGPCMEYIMQHKLIDTMCILGASDTPPGLKRQMFMFVTKLLNIIQDSLIPHVSICVPIQDFIKLCGEVLAGPTESEEMDFLQCICDKIKENPEILNCFFITTGESCSRRSSMTSSSSKDSKNEPEKEYIFVSALLKLYQSPDNDICTRAGDCLKSLCSSADDNIAVAISRHSNLSQVLCSSVVSLYRAVPNSIKLSDIENPLTMDEEVGSNLCAEKRKYLCFIQQLLFIDAIAEKAHNVIRDDISEHFQKNFLETCIYPSLTKYEDTDKVLLTTTLVSSTIRHIRSEALIDAFGRFLLDDSNSESSPSVKSLLIKRCYDSNENLPLSMCTLQLFEDLLIRPTHHILKNLVLKFVENRSYYDQSAPDSWLQFSDEDNCSKYSDDLSSESAFSNKSSAPTYISRVIDTFIALLPEDLKSCESREESGYEIYIKEAHMRVLKCLAMSEKFNWPQSFPEKETVQSDDSSSESQPEADSAQWSFYEGDFLKMIFDKLEQLLHQPHEINLQLTSIVSSLALFAHPCLHEYMLNPLIALNHNVRSLYSVLLKMSEDIQKEVPEIGGFKTKLKLTRSVLLTEENEYATFEESNVLESLIVLEEFCKELAAIAFVKYTIT